MDENKAIKLLKGFMDWYESTTGDNLSGYDQDTTPYAVWEFLAHTDKRHLTSRQSRAADDEAQLQTFGGVTSEATKTIDHHKHKHSPEPCSNCFGYDD